MSVHKSYCALSQLSVCVSIHGLHNSVRLYRLRRRNNRRAHTLAPGPWPCAPGSGAVLGPLGLGTDFEAWILRILRFTALVLLRRKYVVVDTVARQKKANS